MKVSVFRAIDLADIAIQAGQPEFARARFGRAAAFEGPRALTARDDAGRVLLCGGAWEMHAGHATLWAAVSRDAGPAMVALTRRVRLFVDRLPHKRLDCVVRVGFAPGARWMAMLGFAPECTMADYFEDGDAAMVYRRIG